jgi:hypothetical protein
MFYAVYRMTELLNQTVVLWSLSNLGISGRGAAEPRNNEKMEGKDRKDGTGQIEKLDFRKRLGASILRIYTLHTVRAEIAMARYRYLGPLCRLSYFLLF